MKILREKRNAKGARVVTVELLEGERLQAIDRNLHYQLPYPMDYVFSGDVLANPTPVVWDNLEQRWLA